MSRILEYITNAMQGLERYFTDNKLVVLMLTVLLVCWLTTKKRVQEKDNRMLVYTLILSVILICPVTAAVVMIYQTGFYDYEWAWSMVPVTAVIAYGATILVDSCLKKNKVLPGVLVVAAVLFISGNQGTLQLIDTEEAEAKEDVEELLQCMQEKPGQKLLWAPKEIMQEVRRQDGKILLIYGRDMWDAKAGAYDYEAYSEGLTKAYLWLEELMIMDRRVSGLKNAVELVETACEEQGLAEQLPEHMELLVTSGVNTYVLPNVTATYVKDALSVAAKEQSLKVDAAYTEEYTIYFLE